jgi:hypothetical protein
LNLQHASVVINMDLPWNPAVLEQRIGRVHRLGQRRPVQVINFVAQGTIEEGMLSLLQFKRSLFAGVLDGGDKEVFLGGSRLNRFMESVEKASAAIPAAQPADSAEDRRSAAEPEDERRPTPVPAAADPLTGLLQNGLALLEQFAGVLRSQPAGGPARPGLSFLARDERTGETYLRVPVANPQVLEKALEAVGTLLEGLRQR